MKPGTSVSKYITSLTDIQLELAGSPEEITDDTLKNHLPANLTDDFKGLVDIITYTPPEDESFDSISTMLIEYETSNALRKAQVGSNTNRSSTLTEGNALAADGKDGNGNGNRSNGKRHGNGKNGKNSGKQKNGRMTG